MPTVIYIQALGGGENAYFSVGSGVDHIDDFLTELVTSPATGAVAVGATAYLQVENFLTELVTSPSPVSVTTGVRAYLQVADFTTELVTSPSTESV